MTIKIKRVARSLQKTTAERRKALEQRVAQRAIAASTTPFKAPEMKLRLWDIAALKCARWRARKDDEAQLTRVMQGLAPPFGQRAPVIIRGDGTVINGHTVVEGLKRLGVTEVWCVVIDDLDEDEAAMLHLTLNRLGETGEWHMEALGALMLDLGDVGYDLSITGFSLPEIDLITHDALIAKDEKAGGDPADAVPEPPANPVSILGDQWLMGESTLLCGDATRAENYALLLGDEKASAVFTDCPWNIPIKGFVSKKHQDFKAGVGEWSDEEFAAFADRFTQLCADQLMPGGAFFSCIDFRSVAVILAAGEKAGLSLVNLAIWAKGGGGGMGSYLRSAHEMIPIFCKGKKLAVNNVMLGKHGKNRSNVWSYPGANRKGSSAQKAHASHPTPKSVEMVEDALLDVTNKGDLVLDVFLGSGTTLVAATRIGRRARCIELDPVYVDVAVRRWETLTGEQAVNAQTKLTFAEMAAQRAMDDAA